MRVCSLRGLCLYAYTRLSVCLGDVVWCAMCNGPACGHVGGCARVYVGCATRPRPIQLSKRSPYRHPPPPSPSSLNSAGAILPRTLGDSTTVATTRRPGSPSAHRGAARLPTTSMCASPVRSCYVRSSSAPTLGSPTTPTIPTPNPRPSGFLLTCVASCRAMAGAKSGA